MLCFTLIVYLTILPILKFATCEDKCAAFNFDEKNVQLSNNQTVTLKFRIINRCATVGLRNLSLRVASAGRSNFVFCQIDIFFDGGIGNCTEIGSCFCHNDGTFSVVRQLVDPGGEVWALAGRLYNGETFETHFEIPINGLQIASSSVSSVGARSSQSLAAVKDWTTKTISWAVTQAERQELTTTLLTQSTTQYTDWTQETDVPVEGQPTGNLFNQLGILPVAAIGGGLFVLIILLVCLLHCRLMSRINSVQGRQLIASMETDAEVTRRRSRLKQFRSSAVIAARLLAVPESSEARESRIYHEICIDKAAAGSCRQDSLLDHANTYIEMTSPGHAPAIGCSTKENDKAVSVDVKPADMPSAQPVNEDSYLTRPFFNATNNAIVPTPDSAA